MEKKTQTELELILRGGREYKKPQIVQQVGTGKRWKGREKQKGGERSRSTGLPQPEGGEKLELRKGKKKGEEVYPPHAPVGYA